MWTVFISYRRDDSAPYAGRLHDRLAAHFGADSVFMDITHIDIGEDFHEAITRTVSSCSVLIALIGPNWLSEVNAKGTPRLHDPGDFVGLEVAAALERGIRVIPALVGEAEMPSSAELPEHLRKLATRQALEISDTRFHQDVDRLIAVLDKMRAKMQPAATERAVPPPVDPNRASRLVRQATIVLFFVFIVLLGLIIAAILVSNRNATDETAATTTIAESTIADTAGNRPTGNAPTGNAPTGNAPTGNSPMSTGVLDQSALKGLLGPHALTAPLVGAENAGTATVADDHGALRITGLQRSRRGDFLSFSGVITEVWPDRFTFEGTITTKSAKGPCQYNGAMTFAAEGEYWRLQKCGGAVFMRR